jgi:transcriptional regulator with XRE-family HTH domain
MSTQGQQLRAAREAKGWTLAEVSARTRINPRYLEALEKDDLTAFPSGPFLLGFTKKYRVLLDLPEVAPAGTRVVAPAEEEDGPPVLTVTSPAHPSSASRRRAYQTAAVGGASALVLLALIKLFGAAAPTETAAVGEPTDLSVKVDVEEAIRLRVFVDGELRFAEALKPGKAMTFGGRDKVSIEMETLDGLELQFQGKPLKPLGHQSRSRRLVFIDDGE